jgi:hypothetical protein
MRTRSKLAARVAASVVAGGLAVAVNLAPARASDPAPTAPATPAAAAAAPPTFTATLARSYDTFDAHQGVAVDKKYFYVVNNQTITKHDRASGKPLLQFVGDPDGPIIHMDSATVVGDRLYAATSDYDSLPETSSVEVFDTRTMKHVDTYSFGINRGSLTWLDHHDGAWWGGFANYDEIPDGTTEPYGQTINTQVVKLDNDFQVVEAWTIPNEILDRFRPMSNSGGSWGPDGRMWITGHDLDEAYVMEVPKAGSVLQWIATVTLPNVEGQAIAWDRSTSHNPTLWAIKRSTSQAFSFMVPYRSITDPTTTPWQVVGPGNFQH